MAVLTLLAVASLAGGLRGLPRLAVPGPRARGVRAGGADPRAAVMLVAMMANWGTHYELGPPDLPPMGLFAKWVAIGLVPQLTLWIGFTVVVGTISAPSGRCSAGRARAGGPAVASTGRA